MAVGSISKISSALDKSFTSYGDNGRFKIYQVLTFILTFITYALYHANRKVIGIVKTVWSQNCSQTFHNATNNSDPYWCDWAPFDDSNASSLLGWLDGVFLAVYAISMFGSGYLAERSNLRYYLSVGMFFTGFFNLVIGAAFWFDIHVYVYFIIFNSLAGMAQATGWPSVVTLMGNWYGKSKRGFIMGAWNIHTSVGNIFGAFIAGVFVSEIWGLSFAVPAVCIMAFSFIVFFVAVPAPAYVGLENPNKSLASYSDLNEDSEEATDENIVVKRSTRNSIEAAEAAEGSSLSHDEEEQPISLFAAALIPGVLTYSFALFFVKFVNYVFMYWLPKYINSSTDFTAQESANISMFFDLGGIIGGITAGALSDKFKKPANTCFWMLLFSLPMLFIYFKFGSVSLTVNSVLLVGTGFFVNAPYALITTAVSAALGTHESLQGNSKALSTVTALIDGTGSCGAALGPLLTGIMEDAFGWNSVFFMLFGASVLAMLCLLRLVIAELKRSGGCCGAPRSSPEP